MSSEPSLASYLLKVIEDVRPIKGCGELPDPILGAVQVHAWVSVQNSLDVCQIARPMCDGLHDKEILSSHEGDLHTLDIHSVSMGYGFLLEGQPTQADVQID